MPEYQRRLAPPQSASARLVAERIPASPALPAGLRPSQVPPAPAVQAKLTARPHTDRYEREADRAADAIAGPGKATAGKNGLPASLSTLRAALDGGPATADALAGDRGTGVAIRRAAGGGKPLEGALRDAMEEGFGADFSAVRVHSDATAHALSEKLQATAFTSGRDIFLGGHGAASSGAEGQRLIAHELAHVVQQGASSARATGLPPSHVATSASPLVQRVRKEPKDRKLAKERFDQAQQTHRAQSAILKGWVDEGRKSADTRLANSCDWIANGLSALYAVTPTGDSDDRVREKNGNQGNEVAYFPRATGDGVEGGDIYRPDGAGYAYLDLNDNADVTFQSRDTTGWNAPSTTPNKIAVARVPASTSFWSISAWTSRGRNDVLTTLKHEVQHVADHHRSHLDPINTRLQGPVAEAQVFSRLATALGKGPGYDPGDLQKLGPATAQGFTSVHARLHQGQPRIPADEQLWIDAINANSALVKMLSAPAALLTYKTEYRAYSYQGTYDSYDNTEDYNDGVRSEFLVTGQKWTDRQYQIFLRIYRGYPVVEKAWKNNIPFGGKTFREHVIAYVDPDKEGVNKLNSPQVENVYRELQNLPASISVQAPGSAAPGAIVPLLTAIGTLTSVEAAYLLSSPGAIEEFSGDLGRKLPDSLQTLVLGELTKRAQSGS